MLPHSQIKTTLPYLTDNSNAIVLPEYGRNVQKMVEYAMTIESKEERTECVNNIIRTMENLFPYLRNEDSRHKVYDHLARMSNYQLDIDYPYDKPKPEDMHYESEQLDYNTHNPLRMRHYGKILEQVVQMAAHEEDKAKRIEMLSYAANRMAICHINSSKDLPTEDAIKSDILQMTHGRLSSDLAEITVVIPGGMQQSNNTNNQKRKKRKKR